MPGFFFLSSLQHSLKGRRRPLASHHYFLLYYVVLSLKSYTSGCKVDLTEIFNTRFAASLDSELAVVHLDLFVQVSLHLFFIVSLLRLVVALNFMLLI